MHNLITENVDDKYQNITSNSENEYNIIENIMQVITQIQI